MSKKALMVHGGWEGHNPRGFAELFRQMLEADSFSVQVSESLDLFANAGLMNSVDLIVPIYTMSEISEAQLNGVCTAVRNGAGIAGCHGGMCDSFRTATEWQFMTGGQWVAHPGGNDAQYDVKITNKEHPITRGLTDFSVRSEQYYLHVDPAVKVLATTRFPIADGPHVGNGPVDMPVAWTKLYGTGRVFYCSLGHQIEVMGIPQAREMVRRGFLWAARQ
jgi:type 1 glutamine amidotransferase